MANALKEKSLYEIISILLKLYRIGIFLHLTLFFYLHTVVVKLIQNISIPETGGEKTSEEAA